MARRRKYGGLGIEIKFLNVAYCWKFAIDSVDFPIGGMLKLTTRIRTRDATTTGLNGVGFIYIDTFSKDGNTSGLSGVGSDKLPPNFEEYRSSILIGYYPKDAQYISISLNMASDAVGTIEFDDIELSYLN